MVMSFAVRDPPLMLKENVSLARVEDTSELLNTASLKLNLRLLLSSAKIISFKMGALLSTSKALE